MVTMLMVATISAVLPCAIQEPYQENVWPTTSLMKDKASIATLALGVVHLLSGLLLIIGDVASPVDVNSKANGFSFPPGLLTSVGILLVASSLLSMGSVKKKKQDPSHLRHGSLHLRRCVRRDCPLRLLCLRIEHVCLN